MNAEPLQFTKTVAIIQARMSSSRLPGKVLQDIGGEPMLARVVERARRARRVDDVAVATTTDPSDDLLEAFCRERGYPCFRGSLHDVLDRYHGAALHFEAGVVVRITADCPVIDPDEIDRTLAAFHGDTRPQDRVLVRWQPPEMPVFEPAAVPSPAFDFAANRLPPPLGRTFPIGLDTEVCSFAMLAAAWGEALLPYQREHVMPFFYDNPQRFRILLVNHAADYGALRWTVDTPADLELLRTIYARFGNRDDFSWLDVLALFEREPELARINAGVQHKHYRAVDERFDPGKQA